LTDHFRVGKRIKQEAGGKKADEYIKDGKQDIEIFRIPVDQLPDSKIGDKLYYKNKGEKEE